MISALRQPLLRNAPRIVSQRVSCTISPMRSFATSLRASKVETRYTAEHEWVKFDDETNVGIVGITDYAQNSLGDVVFVELPSEGSQVKQGGE
jgi:glycine cleavage system H protein